MLEGGRDTTMVTSFSTQIIILSLDSYVCYTGLLYETVSFCSDPNVYIQNGYDAFTTINIIEKPIITTKRWSIKVLWTDQSTDGAQGV